jgi:aryl-alcohol dehydrogenase-like predicted oxidoreductase
MTERLRQVSIGGSELKVSKIGYGTYHLREKLGASEAIDSLGRAFEAGVNLFDTSDNYGTEDLIGLAVSEGVLPRDEIVIATKTGLATSAREHLEWVDTGKRCDTSPSRIRKQVEASLRLLGRQVDVIDLYQLHTHDANQAPHEIVNVMDELIEEGKIRAWGVSNHSMDDVRGLLEACDDEAVARPVTSQPFLNIVNGTGEEVLGPAEERMTILGHSPLLKGLLTDETLDEYSRLAERDDSPQIHDFKMGLRCLKQIQRYARQRGLTLAQFSVAWAANINDAVVLSACTSQEYLEDAIRGANTSVDIDDPELAEVVGELQVTDFASQAADIMRSAKIYYR